MAHHGHEFRFGAFTSQGFVAGSFGNRGEYLGAVQVELYSREGSEAVERRTVFSAKHQELNGLASAAMLPPAKEALAAAELTLDDIDWIVPHQPNGVMLESIIEALQTLGERPVKARVLNIVEEIGSVGSAAVAVGLNRVARHAGLADQKVLLVASGGGMSYGAMVHRG